MKRPMAASPRHGVRRPRLRFPWNPLPRHQNTVFSELKKILNNKFKERCNQSHIKLIYSIQRWGNLWNRWALLIWHLGRKILILGSPLKIQGLGRKIGKILFFAVLKCFCCFQFWRPDIGFERVGQLKFLFGGN